MEREKLSLQVEKNCDGTVVSGAYQGMRLSPSGTRSVASRGASLLGVYEQEVQRVLMKYAANCDTFIDIGAADGYHAIGVLMKSSIQSAICFEDKSVSREAILENYSINNISKPIHVYGHAGPDFYHQDIFKKINRALVLIDIEGGEFELLNGNVLNYFNSSTFVIELHPFLVENGETKQRDFLIKAQKTHQISLFRMGSRDLDSYNVLNDWPDTDRWLLCSEGRPKNMQFALLTPK